MQGSNYNLTRGLVAKLSNIQGPKCKWPFHISKRRRFKGHCSSSSNKKRTLHDPHSLITPAITVLSLHYQGRRMPFSDYKSQRRDAHRGRKRKSRLAFLCFFSKKQRRLKKKATNRGERRKKKAEPRLNQEKNRGEEKATNRGKKS